VSVMTGTYEGGLVLDDSAHLKSRAFVSTPLPLSASTRNPLTQVTATDDGGGVLDRSAHIKSGAFVSFSRLLYALCLSLPTTRLRTCR
jgi:hypothetical protein